MNLHWPAIALGVALTLVPSLSGAEEPVLLVADPASSLSEVRLAKVLAPDSSSWLSVRVTGKARLAIVFSDSNRERADAADPWLTALDTVTRVRVAPPTQSSARCAPSDLQLSDSGLPEPPHLEATQVISAANELELRRALATLNLNADLSKVAAFAAQGTAPFRLAFYDAPSDAETRAERWFDAHSSGDLPQFFVAERSTLPLTLIALATKASAPVGALTGDPSEFPSTYRAVTEQSDYAVARATWLTGADGRWLVEGRNESAVFAPLELSSGVSVDSALSLYADGALAVASRAACVGRVNASHAANANQTDAYTCETADDLARVMAELSYASPSLSRFFGSVSGDGAKNPRFSEATLPAASSRVIATDLDDSACAPSQGVFGSGGSSGNSSSSEPGTPSTVVRPMPVSGGQSTPVDSSDGSETASSDSGSGSCDILFAGGDSCSGNSSSSDTSSDDSCSGNSSSDSSDSCSGDSSSSSSSDDSGGCGKSNYDGDTCSGNSSSSDRAGSSSAALEAGGHPRRPRRVRLSLLSLIGVAFALPLRRRKSSRGRFMA